MSQNRFVGDTKFIWWLADVEDVEDPEKLGRVRIRIDGYHDKNYQKEDLPWATPISPIQSASLFHKPLADAVGISPTGIEVGSWVLGFWGDHENTRTPFILGTIAAHRFDGPPPSNLQQSQQRKRIHDVHKTAREDNIWKGKKQDILKDPWEPESTYAAKYPLNKVFSTRTGHVIEIDDTPKAERIHIYHKSGTYMEISANGRTVTRITANSHMVVDQDDRLYVKGNVFVNVVGNTTITVGNNAFIDVGRDAIVNVGGKFDMKIGGTCTVQSKGPMQFRAPRIDLN